MTIKRKKKIDKIFAKRIRRITGRKEKWHIAIDDGYCSFLFELNASGQYSIATLFKTIQRKIKKEEV